MAAPTIDSVVQAVYCPFTLSTFLDCPASSTSDRRDSSNIDPPYPAYGGIYREEAIMLLRRFYVQENEKGKKWMPL